MKIQELIEQTHLDLTPVQIKSFFLGALTAEKPMPFHLAMEELLSDSPEVIETVKDEFKKLWDDLKTNHPAELQSFFMEDESLTQAQIKLDYFLTAMSLSGTDTESENEDLAELIDELENTVMDLDEYFSLDKPNAAEELKLRGIILKTWQDFIRIGNSSY